MRARNNDGERAQQRARGEEEEQGEGEGEVCVWGGAGDDPVLPKIKAVRQAGNKIHAFIAKRVTSLISFSHVVALKATWESNKQYNDCKVLICIMQNPPQNDMRNVRRVLSTTQVPIPGPIPG